jgi:hypothetical protein
MGNFLLTGKEVRLTGAAEAGPSRPAGGRYKWVALSNTTAAVLMATMNGSIVLIAMPAIFRGIGLARGVLDQRPGRNLRDPVGLPAAA